MQGLISMDQVRVYDTGDAGDPADLIIPTPILDLMGVTAGQAIQVRVSDDSPEQLHILGPATNEDPRTMYTVVAHPVPQQPGRFTSQLNREWKEKHWRQPEEDMNDFGDDPYAQIEVDYTIEDAKVFLKEDGTLVIPL